MLELILGILAHGRGRRAPHACGFTGPRPGAPADPVPGPGLRRARVRHALDISAAFGGANAVLVYGAPTAAARARRPRRRRRAVIRCAGLGAGVAARSRAWTALAQALAAGTFGGAAGVPPLDLGGHRAHRRSARLRPLQPVLTVAAARRCGTRACPRAGRAGADTGLFLAATRMPPESARRCQESLDRHGPAGMSAAGLRAHGGERPGRRLRQAPGSARPAPRRCRSAPAAGWSPSPTPPPGWRPAATRAGCWWRPSTRRQTFEGATRASCSSGPGGRVGTGRGRRTR